MLINDELKLEVFVDKEGRLDPRSLEEERRQQEFLARGSGDEFLVSITEKYVDKYPLILDEGHTFDRFLESVHLLDQESKQLMDSVLGYDIAKELLLIPLSDSIHYLIHEEKRSAKEESMSTWLEGLARHKYHIDIPVSNLQKVIKHLKNGDLPYLWHKATTSYWKEASLLALGGLLSLLLIVYLIVRRRKIRRA